MILLARHGETEWNVERRIQGSRDSELTARGVRQAAAMADLIGDLVRREAGPWRLLSSPQRRAHVTAQAIADVTGLALEVDDRLREAAFGAWEGHSRDDLAARHPDLFSTRRWLVEAPDGERYEDILARAASLLADLRPEPARRVILVSHGITGRLIRAAYAGLDRNAGLELDVPQDAVFRLQNGQIDRFDCEPIG